MGSEQLKSFGRERKRDTKRKVKHQASAIPMRSDSQQQQWMLTTMRPCIAHRKSVDNIKNRKK